MKKINFLLFFIFIAFSCEKDEYVEFVKAYSKISIARGDTDFHSLIVKQANEEWKYDDHSMISCEIKRQCKALYEFVNMSKPTGMTENTFRPIQLKAMDEWTETDANDMIIEIDWTMALYEMKKEIKVYLEML